ncbi:MAG: OmpA family protein [Gammaproteobacteria bacterium]|jgi:OOP family OmpA-OmpF porin
MKNDYKFGGIVASIAAGLLFASSVTAHEAGKAGMGYLGDVNGHYVTDSAGNCVRTGFWNVEDMTVDCGLEVVAEAPPPAPMAPAAPVYTTSTIKAEALFDFDKSTLKPAGKEAITALDNQIKSQGSQVIDINVVGHTDSIGTEEYNQALSLRRATSVKDYMVSEGIDPGIIDVSGKGESDPVASNDTKEGRALNRRVDISVGLKVPKN